MKLSAKQAECLNKAMAQGFVTNKEAHYATIKSLLPCYPGYLEYKGSDLQSELTYYRITSYGKAAIKHYNESLKGNDHAT